MMEKSLSYAYAEGGEVPYRDPYGRAYLSYEAVDDPNKFKYTMYNYEGRQMQSGVQDKTYLNNLFGTDTINTGGSVKGLQMVAPITDPNNIQVLDQAGRDRIVGGDLDYSYMAPRQEAAPSPVPQASPYRREGVEFVEYNGQMVPKDALNALQGAVGLLGDSDSAEVMRYDVDGDGRVTAGDALAFLKYGSQEGYSDNADFFSNFYGSNTPPPPTVYEQGQGVADTGTAGQTLSFTPFNVFGGIDYTNPMTNTGTTVPTVNTPVVPTVNRTYGTYTPPDATQSLTGMGDNRSYGSFTGTGTQVTPPQSTFVQPAALDTSSVFDPVRQGLGSLFDRAKSLQGQSNYVNPFLRPGG